MEGTQVQSLGCEDPLEKGMAPHHSMLAWRIPWTEGPGRLPSMGSQKVGHNLQLNNNSIKQDGPDLVKQNQLHLRLHL